jgi:hypothetical protein
MQLVLLFISLNNEKKKNIFIEKKIHLKIIDLNLIRQKFKDIKVFER